MIDTELNGKKILLLAPYFFGYENKITTKLEDMGAFVTYVNDDPSNFNSTLIETFRYFNISQNNLLHRFENQVLNQIGTGKFDILILINGWALTERIVKIIKNDYLEKDGWMVLYYWDSIRVLKDDPERRKYFDLISTFDNIDYLENPGMRFIPLFYCDEYVTKDRNDVFVYDLATVGSYKYNRYFEIESLKEQNKDINIKDVLYATKMVKIHKALRKKYKDVDIKRFVYDKLSSQEVIDIFKKSKAILDIPISGQNGLTMRTFECLAMKKKIITTNSNIKNYDFYDPKYIYILDGNSYKLPSREWFETEGYIDTQLINKYNIEIWLKTLLGMEEHSYLIN